MSPFLIALFLPSPLNPPTFSCGENNAYCRIERVVDHYREMGLLSGTLRVRLGDRDLEWDLGLADDGTGVSNTSNTIFLIASDSKAFVAASILKLEETGKLHLQDRLHSWIPEYPSANLTGKNGKIVTLENLLTHTSGIPEAYDAPAIEEKLDRSPLSFTDMMRAVDGQSLRFSPGARYEYSNTGYVMLGEVVHRASGESYTRFLDENILEPLDLSEASVGPPAKGEVARSYDYRSVDGERVDYRLENGLGPLAASEVFTDTDIYCSPRDLERWTDLVTGGFVLSPESTAAMLTPHLRDYGYGWIIFHDDQGRLAYEHAGDYGDFQSWARRYPDDDVTLTWLSNQAMDLNSLTQFIDAVGDATFGP